MPSSSANATTSSEHPSSAHGHPLGDGERREHAERAVVPAGVGDRVDVRAEHEGPTGAYPADHVADGIAPDGQPGVLHPRRHPVAGTRERRRREPACEPAVLLADRRELVGAGEHVCSGSGHGPRR